MNAKEYDYLILGGGPGGLQLGYEMAKNGRNYAILESGDGVGSFFKLYPRHRKLLSINKVYTGFEDSEVNLRWDWNSFLSDSDEMLFKHYSKKYLPDADDLVRYMEDFAKHFKLNVKLNTHIVHITRDSDGMFRLTSSEGDLFGCKRLIVATGMSALNVPPVPGIEMAESYADVSVDPDDFTNQSVLIIGKGNSAFEVADSLIETTTYIHVLSPQHLSLAWESRFVGDLRAVNNNFIDTYQLKCQNAILDGIVTKIEKKGGQFAVSVSYSHASGEKEVLIYDRVIIAAGFRFDKNIFDEPCLPRLTLNDRFPEQTLEWESTTVKDLYFAGTLMQMRDYRKSTSSFIHGFRYCVRALGQLLENKYHQTPWDHQLVAANVKALTDLLLERLNRTSALWQQFGFFCDLLVARDEGYVYYRELTTDLVDSPCFNAGDDFVVVTLNFGKVEGNIFNIERVPKEKHADQSTFLHPIIKHYHKGKLITELHLLEDLHADWSKKEHYEPLKKFFEDYLKTKASAALPTADDQA